MPSKTHNLLSYLRGVTGAWRNDPRADDELLARFTRYSDEEAFKALVGRYGLLVWRSCTRVLGEGPDAEDAFQAVFLALARKAHCSPIKNLAGWLHQVARRAALNAEAGVRRRQSLEQQLRAVTRLPAEEGVSRAELYAALDEELAGLSEPLRVPLLLHYLEGKSQIEVARLLGCTRNIVQYRLARGEAALRKRLERRGLSMGLGAVAMLLGSTAGVPAVPACLIGSTARAAMAFRTGALATWAAKAELRSLSFPPLESSVSAALAEGVMKTMLATKMKIITVLLGVTICLAGGGVLAYQALAGNTAEPPRPANEPRGEAEAIRQPGPGKRATMRVDCYGDPLPEGALARLGTVRLRHLGGICSVIFWSDGKTVASGGRDGVVRLWEVATGKEIRTWWGPKVIAFSMAFSPDGKTVVSGGQDGTVLWEAATGKEIQTLEHKKRVMSVAFSPDGKTVASGEVDDGTVHLFEAATGKEIRTLKGHRGWVRALAFSPDGKVVATGARLWEAATGKEIRTLESPGGAIWLVAFSPDGKTVASGGEDGVVLCEAVTGKGIRTLKGYNVVICAVAFSPDGKSVVTGGDDGTVRLWEVATGKEIHTWPGHKMKSFISVAFSRDGKTVASGGMDGVVRLWEVATGKEISTRQRHKGSVRSVSFAPGDKTVITGGVDGTVRLWEAATGKEIRTWWPGFEGWACAVAFSPDGKTMVMGEQCDGTLHLRKVVGGKKIHTLEMNDVLTGRQIGIWSAAFSPDGRTVATGDCDHYGTVHLWDVTTGKEIHTWRSTSGRRGDQGRVWSVAFSPDGKVVVTGGQTGAVRLWETATGKEICTLRVSGTEISGVALSPDGRTLAAVSDRKGVLVGLWDFPSSTLLATLAGHQRPILGLAFSSNGRTLASVSEDTTGLVWEVSHRAARLAIKPDPVALRALWADLASADAAQAGRAVWSLVAMPAQSVPLLRDRLRPVPADAGKRLTQLVADLDAQEFKVREGARRKLEELGPDAEPALRTGLEGNPSVEMRKRLEQLLELVVEQKKRGSSGKFLRRLRAVMVLEQSGTPEAREVLKTLAAGAAGFPLTQEAQSALRRLDKARRP